MLGLRLFIAGAVLLSLFFWFTAPPFSFPTDSIVVVSEGTGLFELSEKLREERVVRSPFWFRVAAIVLGGERDMKAGEYYMSRPENTFVIAWRVLHGDYDIETIKMTIPEGFTVEEISSLFDDRFQLFDHHRFMVEAREGYLFPDTYFMPVSATASSTILLLENNFERRVFSLLGEIEASGHSLDEIIKMASILESELKTIEDKKIASGILWKRLKLGMPLQVDSDPDTYKHTGFPPKPISNPGIESVLAALRPTTTSYLYFLTGDDGTTHYSKTFEEHVAKKLKYIKR
ncbi:MAG: endolytic transglycosylase MltG [Minisyncoccia bacterium]